MGGTTWPLCPCGWPKALCGASGGADDVGDVRPTATAGDVLPVLGRPDDWLCGRGGGGDGVWIPPPL